MNVENKLKVYFNQQMDTVDGDINIEKSVMGELERPVAKRGFRRKRVLVLAMVLSVVFISTGLVYGQEIINTIKDMVFKNDEGEVEWTLTTVSEDLTRDPRAEKAKEAIDKFYHEQGKAAAVGVYVTKDNPNNTVTIHEYPETVYDIDEINNYASQFSNKYFQETWFDKFYFAEGIVRYNITNEYKQTAELREEAERSEEVVVRELELSDTPNQITCRYFVEGKEEEGAKLIITILACGNNIGRDERENLKESTTISVAGSEVLYDEFYNGEQNVTWITDYRLYFVSSYEDVMSKEELLSIVEQIKQQ